MTISDTFPGNAPARLRLEHVSTTVLEAVDLALTVGECVTLSAPSGTGKTRLLRAIADLDEHGGRIYVDDMECRQWEPPRWRCAVGLLPAESQWWYDTVAPHFPDTAPQQFDAVGFDNTVLDEKVAHLSSGERQRLALIRLLCNRPRVLLLDEPTSSLDVENTSRVEGLIETYRHEAGAAVIWVSHDLDQIQRVADRHYTIKHGRLASL